MKKTLYILSIILLVISFIKISIIPKSVYPIIKLVTVLLGLIFIGKNSVKIKKNKKCFSWLILYTLAVIVSSIINSLTGNISAKLLFDGLFYCLLLIVGFSLIQYGIEKYGKKEIITILYRILIIYVVFSLASIAIMGVHPVKLIQYFAGNKFATSYTLLFFCVIFAIKFDIHQKHKVLFLILAVITTLTCAYLQCSTATLASFLLYIIPADSQKIRSILASPKCVVVALLLAALFALTVTSLLQVEQIQYFITEILHKQITLTGRTDIYRDLPSIVARSPWIGYGYGSTIVEEVVGYGNAQNGLLHLQVQYGVLGVICYIRFLVSCISSKNKLNNETWPLIVFVYVMLICSTVEISLNLILFMALFILSALKHGKEKELK